MDDRLQKLKAFHLTGRTEGSVLKPLTDGLRPAMMARFADTASLRYDFPLILNRNGGAERPLLSLSAVVDEAVETLAGDERDRAARLAYSIEKAVRRRLAKDGIGDFRKLWDEAVEAGRAGDAGSIETLGELRREFRCEGEILGERRETPDLVITHCWRAVAGERTSAMKERIRRLIVKLEGLLAAEAAGSAAGRSPDRLMAGIGNAYAAAFDFDAMSKILSDAKPGSDLGNDRRERIAGLVEELREQKFYSSDREAGYAFLFEHPSDALNAYRERHGDAVRFLRTLRIAELEAAGDYRDRVHDPIFDNFGAAGLDPDDLAELPDYLVCCAADELGAEELSDLVEMLAAGVPFKVLVRTDDILNPSPVAEGHVSIGLRARQIVQTAIGLTDVFVLQTPASRLYSDRGELLAGLRFPGPALFSVYSGADENHSLDPYLASAAALASRAFPAIAFDPETGGGKPARARLFGNPCPEEDWETHTFIFEDGDLQAHSETAPFTFADLLATDERFRGHFAVVSKEAWSGEMVPLASSLNEAGLDPDSLPYITLAGPDGDLHRVLVDHRIAAEARRCRSMWLTLRELNREESGRVAEIEEAPAEAEETAAEAAVEEPGPAVAHAESSDDPYIETARCTSCNECTQINSKMFAYDENKQAYIKDPDAGTFRQLVEAAESCQVSIIHPGKPRNPKEPGLEDLVKRATEFN